MPVLKKVSLARLTVQPIPYLAGQEAGKLYSAGLKKPDKISIFNMTTCPVSNIIRIWNFVMSKLRSLVLDGYELVFYSGDHNPPHFHLISKDGLLNIRVLFLECTLERLVFETIAPPNPPKSFIPLPNKVKKKLLRDIVNNRTAILNEFQKSQTG